MLDQGETVMWMVRKPDFKLTGTIFADAVGLGRHTFEKLLAEPVVALGKSIMKVDHLQRLVELYRIQNWQARAELDLTYVWTGKLTQALCHLAGRPDLVNYTHKPLRKIDRRLRPRKRKLKRVVAAVQESDLQIVESIPAAQESNLQVEEGVIACEESFSEVATHVPELRESDLQVAPRVPQLRESVFQSQDRSLRENRRQLTAQTGPGSMGVRRMTVKRSVRRRFGPRSTLSDALGGARQRQLTPTTGVGSPREGQSTASTGHDLAKTGLKGRIWRFFSLE
jgi:hypothetical protein